MTWLALVAIFGLFALYVNNYDYVQLGVGSTNLDVEFAIIDADTGKSIPRANVFVTSENPRYSDNGELQFRIVADERGRIKRRFDNCSIGDKETMFTYKSWVVLPFWEFWVSAPGYQKTNELELNTIENARRVRGVYPLATLLVEIPLKKIPPAPKDSPASRQ